MKIRDLSQLYWLNREIERDRKRLRSLELRATSIASSSVPKCGSRSGPRDPVGNCASAIADLKAAIQEKLERCEVERHRLQTYINGIEDSLTRQLFEMRFIEGKSYETIAQQLGGGNTYDGVRKRIQRYLKSQEDDAQ